MSADFANVYDDRRWAGAYATLEFPGTYYLAFRDLPAILHAHVRGTRAVDFGCGAGRSTRFLRGLGFDVVGLDIAEHMLERARERDPEGDYRFARDGELGGLEAAAYDLVLSAFTFDNVPTMEKKVRLMRSLRELLEPGVLVYLKWGGFAVLSWEFHVKLAAVVLLTFTTEYIHWLERLVHKGELAAAACAS